MKGKGIYLWRAGDLDEQLIVDRLVAGGFERVEFKVAEAIWTYQNGNQPELVRKLQAVGIKVYGYGFCYGRDPAGEGRRGAERVAALGLDGYIFDVEGAFEQYSNAVRRAGIVCQEFREQQPSIDLAFCSWPLYTSPKTGGRWHKIEVAQEFMKYCDIVMPMCYWGYYGDDPSDAVDWLDWALQQNRAYTDKPIVPVGRAYRDSADPSWLEPKIMAVNAFDKAIRIAGLQGISWWEMAWCMRNRPALWQAIKDLPNWGTVEPPPPPPPPVGYDINVSDDERAAILSLAEKLNG